MSRTAIFVTLVTVCLLILIIYAANLFTLSIIYRLELIEQDIDFILRHQEIQLDRSGRLLDIFGDAAVGEFETTAYTKECGWPWDDGITATGTVATAGRTIAVDPQVIKLGSRVLIPGRGMYHAEDVGGAIKGNRLDIFFDNKKDALLFGRRNLKAVVLP